MNELKLSVIIPAYNEQENLPKTISELHEALAEEGMPYEIIVVNDSSTDKTAKVAESLGKEDGRVRLVHRPMPRGFGRAVRSGLANATGDVLIPYMADCSDDPRDAVTYYRMIEQGFDCVFGSRFVMGSEVRHYPRLKLVVNRIVNKIIQWMFRCPFNDLTNAFKAYRSHVVRECGPYQASHFNITIEMSLNAINRRYRIAQVPIRWYGRTWGSSNLKLHEMGRRYLATLIKAYSERVLISDDLIAECPSRQEPVKATPVSTDHALAGRAA